MRAVTSRRVVGSLALGSRDIIPLRAPFQNPRGPGHPAHGKRARSIYRVERLQPARARRGRRGVYNYFFRESERELSSRTSRRSEVPRKRFRPSLMCGCVGDRAPSRRAPVRAARDAPLPPPLAGRRRHSAVSYVERYAEVTQYSISYFQRMRAAARTRRGTQPAASRSRSRWFRRRGQRRGELRDGGRESGVVSGEAGRGGGLRWWMVPKPKSAAEAPPSGLWGGSTTTAVSSVQDVPQGEARTVP